MHLKAHFTKPYQAQAVSLNYLNHRYRPKFGVASKILKGRVVLFSKDFAPLMRILVITLWAEPFSAQHGFKNPSFSQLNVSIFSLF